jgi:putative endonuclease
VDCEKKYYVYILKCADGTYYTGWTTDPEKRVRVHNSGKGAKYTRARRPVELIYTEEYRSKTDALSREYAIKQLTRKEKEELVDEITKPERSNETPDHSK